MPAFSYQAYDAAGRLQSGSLQAASKADAIKLLGDRGLLPFDVQPTLKNGARPARWTLWFDRPIALATHARIAHELSMLLLAGVPLDQALRLMIERTTVRKVKRLLENLLDSVAAGASLSSAVERHAPKAPAYMVGLIKAGEARGTLGAALADLAAFVQRRADIQEKLRSALTYPMILAATAVFSVGVLVSFLVPALMPFFNSAGAEPPLMFKIFVAGGAFVSDYWMVLLVASIPALLLVSRASRSERSRFALDRMLLRLPMIGRLVADSNVALMARTLGTLLRSGVAIVPALNTTADIMPSRVFAATLRDVAVAVSEGGRLSALLQRSAVVPRHVTGLIAIGEDASNLDGMLLHLAEITDTDTQRAIERIMTLLPPTLTILIGVVVGTLIVGVMQAIVSVNELAIR